MVLENVSENLSTELLLMLVENVSGSDESRFSLETIWESRAAVVVFSDPAGEEGHEGRGSWTGSGSGSGPAQPLLNISFGPFRSQGLSSSTTRNW